MSPHQDAAGEDASGLTLSKNAALGIPTFDAEVLDRTGFGIPVDLVIDADGTVGPRFVLGVEAPAFDDFSTTEKRIEAAARLCSANIERVREALLDVVAGRTSCVVCGTDESFGLGTRIEWSDEIPRQDGGVFRGAVLRATVHCRDVAPRAPGKPRG
ncbi:hypothetical protein DFJ74DRAFT_237978 [Hyaloraphidium curvatum]|nr:hypothetical protein DFJ74DRAFT_237978 [Hyaloraphidium curvatum]